MAKVPLLSGLEICKALKRSDKLTFRGIGGRNHAIFTVKNTPVNISIPLHKEVSRFLLKEQLKLAGITLVEFLKFLGRKR